MSVLKAPANLDPTPENIKALVESWMPQYLKYVEELVLIGSGSMNVEGITKCAERISQISEEVLGFPAVINTIKDKDGIERSFLELRAVPEGERPTKEEESANPSYVLHISHYDTVFPKEQIPVFSQDDQYIYGQGVFDDKAAIISDIFGLRLLQIYAPKEVQRWVKSLVQADEEIGSLDGRGVIAEHLRTAKAGLVFEGLDYDGENYFLRIGRKGFLIFDLSYRYDDVEPMANEIPMPHIARYVLRYKGIAAHSGAEYHLGADATYQAIIDLNKIADLAENDPDIRLTFEALNCGTIYTQISDNAQAMFSIETTDPAKLDRVTHLIERMLPTIDKVTREFEHRVLSELPADFGSGKKRILSNAILQTVRDNEALKVIEDIPSGLTINVGVIRTNPSSGILVQQEVVARAFENRHLTVLDNAAKSLQQYAPNISRAIEDRAIRNPWPQTTKSEATFELVQQVHDQLGFPAVKPKVSGGITDVNSIPKYMLGIDGLGPAGYGDHSDRERVLISDIPRSIIVPMIVTAAILGHQFYKAKNAEQKSEKGADTTVADNPTNAAANFNPGLAMSLVPFGLTASS